MSLRAVNLEELRKLVAPKPRESVQFSRVENGIPKGALTEISGPHGSGKTELVLRFLAENRELRAAWIEDTFTAYPRTFPQLGVSLERILFVEAGPDVLWTALQTLRSGLFGAVIVSATITETIDLRRLQLAAETARATVIILNEKPVMQAAWPITKRLQITNRILRKVNGR